MAEINAWFQRIPPITRHWFAASVALPVLCRFGIFSPYTMVFTSDFLSKLALWKPITSVFYYPLQGNKGFHFLVNLYFIYNYSQRLELGFFDGRPADYVFMLLFNWLCLLGLAFAFGVILLMDPMVMSTIYVYCMLNQDQIVSFWFGTRFKARYLPWALFGVNFLLAGGGMVDFLGILVGHLYYFVMVKYPSEQGSILINTPQLLYKYLPNRESSIGIRMAPNPSAGTNDRQNTGQNSSAPGYNWGRGRRLQD